MTDNQGQNKPNCNDKLYEAITKLKEVIITVRRARIYASQRLYNYDDHWSFIILMMNILSSGLLIYSLVKGSSADSPSAESYRQLFISACFSIYSMIMQFYYSTLNYRERGLKLHYHELELEELVRKLEDLERKRDCDFDAINEVEKEYQSIRKLYHKALQDQENHSEEDYWKAKAKMEKDTKYLTKEEVEQVFEDKVTSKNRWGGWLKGVTGFGNLDKFTIRMQYIIIPLVVLLYIFIERILEWLSNL